jgi:hypothetical protein
LTLVDFFAEAGETVSSIRTVRAFANEPVEDEKYHEKLVDYYNLARKMGIAVGLFQGNRQPVYLLYVD